MRFLLLLTVCLCALQSIYGDEGNLDEVLARSREAIQEFEEHWSNDVEQAQQEIRSTITASETQFIEAYDRIAATVDSEYLESVENIKTAYKELVAVSLQTAEKMATLKPQVNKEVLKASEISSNAFDTIVESINSIKEQTSDDNTCKTNIYETFISGYEQYFQDVINCIVDRSILLVPYDAQSIIADVQETTIDYIVYVERCIEDKDAECFGEIIDDLKDEIEDKKKAEEEYTNRPNIELDVHRENSRSCVKDTLKDFGVSARKAREYIEQCG